MRPISGWIILLIIGVIALGPFFTPVDPLRTQPESQLQPPGSQHLFGTDLLGRDVFSRVLHGGRLTILVAVLSTLLAAGIGIPIGGAAAMWSHHLGIVLMIIINALLAIPGLVIALVIVTLLGRGSLPLIIALGVAQIAPFAFMTRNAVLAVRSQVYVDAALALGARSRHILWQHLLPNIQPTILAFTGIVFSYALLNGAALSFLGVGNELGIPDWGVMLAEGRAAFRTAPWIGLAPGLAITVLVWAINDVADQIRLTG